MKKVNIYRFCNYALMSLISCSLVLNQIAPASPQTVSLTNTTFAPATNLIWPTQGVLSQGFRKYQHEGIDIAGAKGTPILAAAAGTVVKAGWDDWGLGNFIEIKHLNGNVTVYGHNSRLLVSKGQQVKQGQIIAEMGSTGNSTAPHLHFEFYADGRLASNIVTPAKVNHAEDLKIFRQLNDDLGKFNAKFSFGCSSSIYIYE